MSEQVSVEVIESGVDYLTATARKQKGYALFAKVAERELRKEQMRGNEMRRASFHGYSGFQCGSLMAGAYNGSMLIRAGGHIANENWRELVPSASNVSRLDIQATARFDPERPRLAERAERDAAKFIKARNRQTTLRLIRDSKKGSTLYIGRRVSDRYARLYNKHTETGLDHYKGAWRFEVELKRALAFQTARELAGEREPEATALAMVITHFRSNGVVAIEATAKRRSCLRRQRADSDATSNLKYLSRMVAPMIARLRCHVSDGVILRALALGDIADMLTDDE